MNYNLEGKIVLITGGSRGLGRTMIDEFQKQRCIVVFASRDSELGEKVSKETGAEYVQFDLEDRASIEKLMSHVAEKYGRLDILVNNAALTSSGSQKLPDLDAGYVRDVFTFNCIGTMCCMQEAIKIMEKQESRGCIVNISSATSIRGGAGLAPYAASKAAINSMTASAAAEFACKGIRINAVVCGVIATETSKKFWANDPARHEASCAKLPVKYVAEPEEMCKPVLWLCSEDASYMHGACIACDGGYNL